MSATCAAPPTVRPLSLNADDVDNLLFACAVPSPSLPEDEVRAISKEVMTLLPKEHIKMVEHHGTMSCVGNNGQVQLLARRNVNVALYSRTLRADAVIDAFLACRDGNTDPKERALALKDMLRQLSSRHSFSLVLFDQTSRAFAASTRQSAPLAFAHDSNGTVVLTCSLPRSRTPITAPPGTSPNLVHLPAGRYIYGNRYLRPCEFTAFWGSANASRAGASVQHFDSTNAKYDKNNKAVEIAEDKQAKWRDITPVHMFQQPEEVRSWRWQKDTSSECDRADSWRAKKPVAAPLAAAASTFTPAPKPAAVVLAASVAAFTPAAPVSAAASAKPEIPQQPEIPQALRVVARSIFCEGAMCGAMMFGEGAMSPAKRFLTLFVMRTACKLGRSAQKTVAAADAMLEEIEHAAQSVQAPALGLAGAAAVATGGMSALRRVQSARTPLLRADSQRQLQTMLEETQSKKRGQKLANHVYSKASTMASSTMLRSFSNSNLACQLAGTCCYNGVCYI